MTDSGGLQHSLAVMGFPELVLAFAALGCYALVFNGSLSANARSIAAVCAAIGAGGFAALTDPWMNGVILMAVGITGLGVFVAAVWATSAACGLTRRQPREPSLLAAEDALADVAAAPVVRARPHRPAHSA